MLVFGCFLILAIMYLDLVPFCYVFFLYFMFLIKVNDLSGFFGFLKIALFAGDWICFAVPKFCWNLLSRVFLIEKTDFPRDFVGLGFG